MISTMDHAQISCKLNLLGLLSWWHLSKRSWWQVHQGGNQEDLQALPVRHSCKEDLQGAQNVETHEPWKCKRKVPKYNLKVKPLFLLDNWSSGLFYSSSVSGWVLWCVHGDPFDGSWPQQHHQDPEAVRQPCPVPGLSDSQGDEVCSQCWHHPQRP